MANDAPKLNGFNFKHPPKPADVYWEPNLVQHRLSDGTLVSYKKGFTLKGKLSWGKEGWIDADEYSNVVAMYNQLTATCAYYPRPNSYSSRKFNVQISNELDFVPHEGLLQGKQMYEGTIEFESSVGEITATASDIF